MHHKFNIFPLYICSTTIYSNTPINIKKMKISSISFLSKLLILQYLSAQCISAEDFDFFTFILQVITNIVDSLYLYFYTLLIWLFSIALLTLFLMMQWPGSYCDSKLGCCYPKTGKPAADFTIYGLRPSFNNGTSPTNCDIQSVFNKSKVFIVFMILLVYLSTEKLIN